MNEDRPIEFVVSESHTGWRLDRFLVDQFSSTTSRTQLAKLIVAGNVTVDGRIVTAGCRLRPNQRIAVVLAAVPRAGPEPEDIPLEVLYEDDLLVVVNKPPGMVVHAARGGGQGTLASALAYRFAQLSNHAGPARPGIVHRLDRDTSGVIVVAKTNAAHLDLARQFHDRTVQKQYHTIVVGVPDRDRDVIDRAIGRHPGQREKMAIRQDHWTSRAAETYYEVLERFDGFALLECRPRTGRTHQIRVHLGSIGHPVLCDRYYGGRATLTRGEIRGLAGHATEVLLDRQALHASRIVLRHPGCGEPLEVVAPMPADLARVVEALREKE